MCDPPVRRLRADAQRNRDAVLAAADRVFERDGILAPIDTIAAEAGVGNATLYRHFPTRDDLLAAVVEDRVVAALAASADLARELAPDDALREWFYRLAWQLRIWHDLPTCIATAIGHDSSPVQRLCAQLTARTAELLATARRDGTATHAADAEDLFELLTAVSWGVDRFGDDAERARARVELATAGVFAG